MFGLERMLDINRSKDIDLVNKMNPRRRG